MSTARFAWPSATELIHRAEQALNLPPSPRIAAPAAEPGDRFAEMAERLYRYESGYVGLHPPGYESGGRFTSAKVIVKKIVRRAIWWYVEPRWTAHREMTASLAGYAHESIDTMRAIALELAETRARLAALEAILDAANESATGRS